MFRSWYFTARYFAARFWDAVGSSFVEPTPPERIVFPDPEVRTFSVLAETRLFMVPVEVRSASTSAQARAFLVPAESRTSTGSE
jgi:hypothetical protein